MDKVEPQCREVAAAIETANSRISTFNKYAICTEIFALAGVYLLGHRQLRGGFVLLSGSLVVFGIAERLLNRAQGQVKKLTDKLEIKKITPREAWQLYQEHHVPRLLKRCGRHDLRLELAQASDERAVIQEQKRTFRWYAKVAGALTLLAGVCCGARLSLGALGLFAMGNMVTMHLFALSRAKRAEGERLGELLSRGQKLTDVLRLEQVGSQVPKLSLTHTDDRVVPRYLHPGLRAVSVSGNIGTIAWAEDLLHLKKLKAVGPGPVPVPHLPTKLEVLKIHTLDVVGDVGHLYKLRRLCVRRITRVGWQNLSRFPHLVQLELTEGNIEGELPEGLEELHMGTLPRAPLNHQKLRRVKLLRPRPGCLRALVGSTMVESVELMTGLGLGRDDLDELMDQVRLSQITIHKLYLSRIDQAKLEAIYDTGFFSIKDASAEKKYPRNELHKALGYGVKKVIIQRS